MGWGVYCVMVLNVTIGVGVAHSPILKWPVVILQPAGATYVRNF